MRWSPCGGGCWSGWWGRTSADAGYDVPTPAARERAPRSSSFEACPALVPSREPRAYSESIRNLTMIPGMSPLRAEADLGNIASLPSLDAGVGQKRRLRCGRFRDGKLNYVLNLALCFGQTPRGRTRSAARLNSGSQVRQFIAALLCLYLGAASADVTRIGRNVDLAFVLLKNSELPSGDTIVKNFANFRAEGETITRLVTKPSKDDAGQLLEFDLGPCGTAFVTLLPVPVPKGEADDAARYSISAVGTNWKLPPHAAHLLVTLSGSGAATTVARLSCFTSLLAAVSKSSTAVGIYWGNAGATHDPAFFASVAKNFDLTSRLMLWSGISIAREADGRLSLLSLGMKQFDLPDLMLIAPKSMKGQAALATFFDLLAYEAERGKPIPAGETVGRTADERIPVEYVPSPLDNNKQVWRVEFK